MMIRHGLDMSKLQKEKILTFSQKQICLKIRWINDIILLGIYKFVYISNDISKIQKYTLKKDICVENTAGAVFYASL